jgi:hypothetical protein
MPWPLGAGDSLQRSEVLKRRMSFGVKLALAVVAATALSVAAGPPESDFNLTYDKPATKRIEALPVRAIARSRSQAYDLGRAEGP